MLTSAVCKATPISTSNILAGNATSGFSNATGSAARFSVPVGMVYDGNRNLYVADSGNNAIRKVTPTGVVSTYAGSGSTGSNNANGTSATFNAPLGLAIDASSNLYVADSGNNLIRKVDTSRNVTTVAFAMTTPTIIAVDSTATNMIAVDGSSNIYAYINFSDKGRIDQSYGYSNVGAVACRPDGVFYYAPVLEGPDIPGIVRLTFGAQSSNARAITSSSAGSYAGGLTPMTFTYTGAEPAVDPFAVGGLVTLTNFSGAHSPFNSTFTITAYNPGTNQFTVSIAGTYSSSNYPGDPPTPTGTVYMQNPTHTNVTLDGVDTDENYYTQLSFQSTTSFCFFRNSSVFMKYDLAGDAATSNLVKQSFTPPAANFAVKSSVPWEFVFDSDSFNNYLTLYAKQY